MLTQNLAMFNSTATPVGFALVPEDVAATGETVNFAAEKDQFWGFHVVGNEEIFPNMTVHRVPTRSLSQIRVRSCSLMPWSPHVASTVCFTAFTIIVCQQAALCQRPWR